MVMAVLMIKVRNWHQAKGQRRANFGRYYT